MFGKSHTKSKMIFNVVLLALGAVFYVGLWYGTNYVSGVIAKERSKAIESGSSVSRLKDIESLLSKKTVEIEKVSGYFLTDDEVVGFLEELESLATRVGVDESTDLVSGAGYPGLDGAKWEGLQVTLSANGSWTEIYQFLSLLERLPYRADLIRAVVEKVSSPTPSEKARGDWKGSFTIKVLKSEESLP